MTKKKGISLSECKVFFDFDNTITPFDVIDDIVSRFSVNDDWRKLEKEWKQGKISSRECLKGQSKGIKVGKKEFIRYLSQIKVDKYFPKILKMLNEKGVPVAIVSDSFSFIINYILKKNGISEIPVYSNKIVFDKTSFTLKFPHFNEKCPKCANCKKNHILNHDSRKKVSIYVGDGLSDVCPAAHADIIFAKDTLRARLKKQKTKYIPFDTLATVYNCLNELA